MPRIIVGVGCRRCRRATRRAGRSPRRRADARADRVGSAPGDAGGVLPRLLDGGGAECRRDMVCWPANPAIMPALIQAGHRAHHDRVEEQAELASCSATSSAPAGEAEATQGMVGGARGDHIGSPGGLDGGGALLQLGPEADGEAGMGGAVYVGAHDPRQQDVADSLVGGVCPARPQCSCGTHARPR